MELFELNLPDEGKVSGRIFFPENTHQSEHTPLLVCIHGGSYDSEYFDVDPRHSIVAIAKGVGLPVAAIDRPGYGKSTLAPAHEGDETYAEAQGRYLASIVIPALWASFSERTSATSVVLLAHSIGAMMAMIAAGSHAKHGRYPLAGLVVSGIGSELVEETRQGMLGLLASAKEAIEFDAGPKDAVMLQWPFNKLVESDMPQHTKKLNKPIPLDELSDINTQWLDRWQKYTRSVSVPVMYGLGEFDSLWVSSPDAIANFKNAFIPGSCPSIRSDVIRQAPHCIELSLQGKGWYLQCCGFAYECAVVFGLTTHSHSQNEAVQEQPTS